PPPESTLLLSAAPVVSVVVHVRTQQAVQAGTVTVILYRSADGVGLPCGVLRANHDGFAQGAAREVTVTGVLQQARPCAPSDRIRLVVSQLGADFLVTGTPGLADSTLRYFLVP